MAWRWAAAEWCGIALIALAVSFVHIGYSIGIAGVYLLVTGILRQLVETPADAREGQANDGN